MQLHEFMTKDPIVAYEDETIRTVVLRLRNQGVAGVPVLDKDEKCVGDFSEVDLLKLFPDILHEAEDIPLIDIKELTSQLVKDIMSSPNILKPDDDMREAARLLLENFAHRIMVVENDKLVGIVSIGDVLKACYLQHSKDEE
jgi:CBS domain-containing protein